MRKLSLYLACLFLPSILIVGLMILADNIDGEFPPPGPYGNGGGLIRLFCFCIPLVATVIALWKRSFCKSQMAKTAVSYFAIGWLVLGPAQVLYALASKIAYEHTH